MVDRPEQAAVAPIVEVTLNRRGRREIIRNHRPLAARRGHVEDGVIDIAKFRGARSADLLTRRQEWRDMRPLPVRQVTCISATVPRILAASGFIPGHVHLRPVLQRDRITNL